MARTGRPVQVYLSGEKVELLKAVAKANRRTLSAEVEFAIDRHLAALPPTIVADAPPVVAPPIRPKKGRPRKRPPDTDQTCS